MILPSTGYYLIFYTALCTKTGGGNANIDIWIRKNGSGVVTNSNTRVTVTVNGVYIMSAANLLVQATSPNDYFEFLMCGDSTSGGIGTVAASGASPVRPAAPAFIVTINKISK